MLSFIEQEVLDAVEMLPGASVAEIVEATELEPGIVTAALELLGNQREVTEFAEVYFSSK
jgi:hypothetical protein